MGMCVRIYGMREKTGLCVRIYGGMGHSRTFNIGGIAGIAGIAGIGACLFMCIYVGMRANFVKMEHSMCVRIYLYHVCVPIWFIMGTQNGLLVREGPHASLFFLPCGRCV